MEADYSKREIDEFKKDVTERFDRQDKTLVRIENQTTTTNGSVAKLKLWQARTIGALAIISFFLAAIVMPVIVVYLTNYLSNHH